LAGGATVHRRPDGKPEATNGQGVSASRSLDLTLAVAGSRPVACDVERVAARSDQAWRDLLGNERFELAGLVAMEASEDRQRARTRLWAAAECLHKTGLGPDAPLALRSVPGKGWVLLHSGRLAIATWLTGDDGADVVFAVLAEEVAGAGL
jgi:enediyne polyketide synthase